MAYPTFGTAAFPPTADTMVNASPTARSSGSGTVTVTFQLRWGGVGGTTICKTAAITQASGDASNRPMGDTNNPANEPLPNWSAPAVKLTEARTVQLMLGTLVE